MWAMTFDTFTDASWTNNGITATLTNTKPAFERGHYFDSSVPALITLSDFQLSVYFTVSGWLRPDSFSAESTVFSKDQDGTPPTEVFKCYVNVSGNLGVTLSMPASLSTTEEKTGTSTLLVSTWAFVAYSVQLTSSAT